MGNIKARRGVARALSVSALAGLLAACSLGPSAPAPVVMRGPGDSGWNGPPQGSYSPPPGRSSAPPVAYAPPRSAPPISTAPIGPPSSIPLASGPPPSALPPSGPLPSAPPGRIVTVERGQSLGGIAQRYHVSERAIIEANHLRPPYKIEIGARLAIPGGEGPPQQAARQPDVIPLDGPPPAARDTLTPPTAAGPPPAAAPGEASVAEEARSDRETPAASSAGAPAGARGGGRFPWPVRGSVVGGYGAGANGAKNDGINIAAPLGTPVRAIEGGEVAYAGNELKGYGNLVLVKHADGWISAYAHCEELLVKKGDRVAAGQVIAKVGKSGGVNQPQLHFELRRGQRPVDPREFLAPAPSAGKPLGAG